MPKVFERFVERFPLLPPGQVAESAWLDPRLRAATGYEDLAGRFAGCTFENGLYRLHDAESGPRAAALVAEAVPTIAARSCPFAYDWLGRQFAVDAQRVEAGESLVLLIEPGTGTALEVPMTFESFHENLDDYREPALAGSLFLEWAQTNPDRLPLKRTECVGYRVPLFLGGPDTVDNLDVSDLEVYWSLYGQLYQRTRGLQPGTAVGGVSIRDQEATG
jgi:Domain of unknown function (DUF1851)